MSEIYISQNEDIYDFKKCYVTLSEIIWNIKYFLSAQKNEVIFIMLKTVKTELSNKISPRLIKMKFLPIQSHIFELSELNLTLNASECLLKILNLTL